MRLLSWGTRIILRGLLVLSLLFACLLLCTPDVSLPNNRSPSHSVNDVTGMNAIPVLREVSPTSIAELQENIRTHAGAISIGGGRYSMGGQIGADESLHVDMRRMNRILSIDQERKRITVEAGATWRSIQEAIDPLELSVKVMQSYSNFTVGGSLSVNVHGRYVGEGPIIGTVRSIRVVLADGRLVEADRETNSEIFYGCIGGYGALGVIAEATLDLAPNSSIARATRILPLESYAEFFNERIRNDGRVILQNGDLLAGEKVNSVSWIETDSPLTEPHRLAPLVQHPSVLERITAGLVLNLPFGGKIRGLLEPYRYLQTPVVKRNFEAGYDISSLGAISTNTSSFALQEYFVPINKLEDFARAMTRILTTHTVSYLNISIRHVMPDRESLLSWAPTERFALVLYYRQSTGPLARHEVGIWTRELIDEVLKHGGSYYLPYQVHALKRQFLQAYSRAEEFFSLKDRLDPDYKFHNKLWDAYYRVSTERKILEATAANEHYRRAESQTFLTVPEWDLVFLSEDLEKSASAAPPSQYPFLRALKHFWFDYAITLKIAHRYYPSNWGYHLMNTVIGVHTSVEYLAKSLYENSVGRIVEWIAGLDGPPREETIDAFIRDTYLHYAAFIHDTPWYEYPFHERLKKLWQRQRTGGESALRHYERKLMFSVELGVKAVLSELFSGGTAAVYESEDLKIGAVLKMKNGDMKPAIFEAEEVAPDIALVTLPRYERLTTIIKALALAETEPNFQFIEIAGNDRIVVSLTTNGAVTYPHSAVVISEAPSLLNDSEKRVILSLRVSELLSQLRSISRDGATLQHVFDY